MQLLISLPLMFVLVSSINYSAAKQNHSICSEEILNEGLLPPGVPESFTLWASVTDLKKKSTTWIRETYDGLNMRGKYESVSMGIATYHIYDYLKDQVITYKLVHPSAQNPESDPDSQLNCFAQEISNAATSADLPFGLKYGAYAGGLTRIYDRYQVMQFGGNYKFAFAKSHNLTERGIPVNTFRGCVYNEFEDSTYQVNMSWAQEGVLDEIGNKEMPLRKSIRGGYTKTDYQDPPTKKWVEKEEIHEIIYFEDDPQLADEDFQVPTHTSCNFLFQKTKEMPELPEAFSFDMEVIVSERGPDGELTHLVESKNVEIQYDYGLKIARADYEPSVDQMLAELLLLGDFPDSGTVSKIYDFNTGIAYYTHKSTGQCFVENISKDDAFFVSKLNKDASIEMADPNEFFNFKGLVDMEFHYKGKYLSRGIPCDVWEAVYLENDVRKAREVYFQANGFKNVEGDLDTYYSPVRDTELVYVPKLNKQFVRIAESNYFRFTGESPDLTDFEIPNCLSAIKNEKLRLTFDASNGKNITLARKHLDQFVQNLRVILYEHSGVGTPIRIQGLEEEYSVIKKELVVRFVILDNVDVQGKVKNPKGISLSTAKSNLKKSVDSGSFFVSISLDPLEEPIKIYAKKGSLK